MLRTEGINESLKKELLPILSTDQGIREYLFFNPSEARKDSLAWLLQVEKDSIEKKSFAIAIMRTIDEKNMARVEEITAHSFNYRKEK